MEQVLIAIAILCGNNSHYYGPTQFLKCEKDYVECVSKQKKDPGYALAECIKIKTSND